MNSRNQFTGERRRILRKMETTGSARDRGKTFFMINIFKNMLIPKLDTKTENLNRELNKMIVVRYQCDNLSPHVKHNSSNG